MCDRCSPGRARSGNREISLPSLAGLVMLNLVARIVVLFFLILFGCAPFALGQETVTIPKSRLEELERKEAELEKLKGSPAKPRLSAPNSSENSERTVVREKTLPQATVTPVA